MICIRRARQNKTSKHFHNPQNPVSLPAALELSFAQMTHYTTAA